MKIKIKEKGACWEQSKLGTLSCMVCESKNLEFETDMGGKGGMVTTVSCHCGAVFEIEHEPVAG